MYLVDFGLVKLIVILTAECRYKFMNFVDDIHGFFMPVKKDPGLFPGFFNFVDKIHGYFVPVKKPPPGWLPTINSYFCDNMEYPLKWAEWMISTKTGLCVTAGLSLYFVYRKNRTEKCFVAGSLVSYAMKDSPLVQDSIGHINQLLSTHSLLDVGTAICMAAGLTLYFVKRRNRTEKTFVGGCILAFVMRNTSVMQGPIRYVNSLLPLTGFELSAVTGLILYFLYRNNNREKIYVAGSFLIFIFRDSAVVQVPIICGLLLLSAIMQFVIVMVALGGGVCCVGELTMYFYQRESNVEKSCVAGSLLALAYWFRDTPPIRWMTSLLFSKSGMLVVVTTGVAVYLIFFRKKKITPDYIYSRKFSDCQPYFYKEYYQKELDVRKEYHNRNYYRNDSGDKVIIPPVKIVPFQPQSFTRQATFQPQPLTCQATFQPQQLIRQATFQPQPFIRQATSQPQPLIRQATSQPQPLIRQATSQPQPLIRQATSQSQPLIRQATSQPQPLICQATSQPQPLTRQATSQPQPLIRQATSQPQPLIRQATSQPQSLPVTYSSQNQDGLKHELDRAWANETPYEFKPKKKKGSKKKKVELLEIPPFASASNSPKQSQYNSKISKNEDTRIVNVRGPSAIDHTNNCQCNTTKRKKGKGNQIAFDWPAKSVVIEQGNDNHVKTNAECILKQLLMKNTGKASVPSNPEGGSSVSNGQKQQSHQLNIQKQQNNQFDKTASIAGSSNSRGIQISGNPSPVPKQQTHQSIKQTSQENIQLDCNVPLRRPNNRQPSTNDAPNEKFVVRVKLD